MSPQDAAMQTLYKIYSNYEIEKMPSAQTRLEWAQMIERFELDEEQLSSLRADLFARFEKVDEKGLFKLFFGLVQAMQPEQRKLDFDQKKSKCAYCRDRGYASIYSQRDVFSSESVICFCENGNQILERLTTGGKPVKMAVASRDADVKKRVLLFHRHQQERADNWAQKQGSKDSSQASVAEQFQAIFQRIRGGVLQSANRLPEYLDPQKMAYSVYENGDERGERL